MVYTGKAQVRSYGADLSGPFRPLIRGCGAEGATQDSSLAVFPR